MSEERDNIEKLFRKSSLETPSYSAPPVRGTPSLNADDQFPAPGVDSPGMWVETEYLKGVDALDLYWNVFDLSGIIAYDLEVLKKAIGSDVRVLDGSFRIVAMSHPVVWRNASSGWLPGPLTRFSMVCKYHGKEIPGYYTSPRWPGTGDRIKISPAVDAINNTGGSTTYDRSHAGPDGAPFCLYQAKIYPKIKPHYLYEVLIREMNNP